MVQHTLSKPEMNSSDSVGQFVRVLLVGMMFGVVLIKSEVASWHRINDMFLFREPHMYLIIATAVVTGALSMWLIRRYEVKTVTHEPIVYKPKPFQKGVILGGLTFGMGWAVTGACPGPIYAQLGAGEWVAGLTWVGAFAGMYLYGYLRPRLPH